MCAMQHQSAIMTTMSTAMVTVMSSAVVVTAMVAPMLTPVIMAAHFMAITMTLEVIRAPWRLLQEVHRLTAGRIARAMLGPVFGMAWRHIHVDRCTRYIDSRGRDHHGLRKHQRGRRPIADIDPVDIGN